MKGWGKTCLPTALLVFHFPTHCYTWTPPSAASFSEGFNNHLALPWIRRRDWWSSNMAKMRKHHHHPYPFDKMKNYSLENTPPFSSWGRKEESLKTVAKCYRKCTSCQCAVLASSPQTWRKVILLHAKSFFLTFSIPSFKEELFRFSLNHNQKLIMYFGKSKKSFLHSPQEKLKKKTSGTTLKSSLADEG